MSSKDAMSGEPEGADATSDASEQTMRRAQIAATTYAALRSRRRLQSHRMLTYRCPERDMLLDVMKFPAGLVLYVPANIAPVSTPPPAMTQVALAGGGPWTNVRDVEDQSRSRTLMADQCSAVTVSCSHVGGVVLGLDRIRRDMHIGHAVVILTSIDG